MTNSHTKPLPPPPPPDARHAGPDAALTRTQGAARTGAGTGAGAGKPLTPAQAFDALYAFCAPALVRQSYLLTGRRDRAREAVERAFQLAWQRWPEVAHDRDPAGWMRALAYDCALSPWYRFLPRNRIPDPPPEPADRALQHALLRLPPSYRRTLVLYDGVGLDLPETAAETEASTPATANRLMHAREAVAACLPELADPAELHRRLVRLGSAWHLAATGPVMGPGVAVAAGAGIAVGSVVGAGAAVRAGVPGGGVPGGGVPAGPGAAPGGGSGIWAGTGAGTGTEVSAGPAAPVAVRTAGERSTRFWTRSAIAFTVTIIGATALTLHTAPTRYFAPVSPGHSVQGLPAPGALGPLSQQEQRLRAALKKQAAAGPERLAPEAR
ncbi:RNA polymerase sigma factor [Streptomyces sp. NPDC059631]|uniref:RNA polymerase sigma factor n=1 Tax=unclassified Streptomyces TaxID=2593676 RepID=UPI0036943CC8